MGRLVASRVELGHGEGLAAARRDAEESGRGRRGEDDRPIAVPRSSHAPLGVADRQDRPAGRIHPLQLPIGKEADEAAVGRPEWKEGVLRADHRMRGGFVEAADPEGGLPARLGGREDEARSVRRPRWRGVEGTVVSTGTKTPQTKTVDGQDVDRSRRVEDKLGAIG